MIIDDEILNGFSATIASSAKQVHEIAESMEKAKKAKKIRGTKQPYKPKFGENYRTK